MHHFELSPLKKYLHTIVQLTRAETEKRFSKAKVGITPLQFTVLVMTKQKPITINEIARNFSFKAPSLVPAVDALEKAGLLHRKHDTTDRRKTQLVITQKGQDMLKKLPLDDKNDSLTQAFNKFSSVKQKQLLSLLEELTKNFTPIT